MAEISPVDAVDATAPRHTSDPLERVQKRSGGLGGAGANDGATERGRNLAVRLSPSWSGAELDAMVSARRAQPDRLCEAEAILVDATLRAAGIVQPEELLSVATQALAAIVVRTTEGDRRRRLVALRAVIAELPTMVRVLEHEVGLDA